MFALMALNEDSGEISDGSSSSDNEVTNVDSQLIFREKNIDENKAQIQKNLKIFKKEMRYKRMTNAELYKQKILI